MVPRGRMYRYPARDTNASAAAVGGGMLPVPYDMGGMLPREPPMPITALASALANASPEQQRTVYISKLTK